MLSHTKFLYSKFPSSSIFTSIVHLLLPYPSTSPEPIESKYPSCIGNTDARMFMV
ncbi:MAG: hypothetical protein IKJ56_02135 [Bacteroidales bacterium]|nr:hypothetical protein [Bacteroidales bacterium]